MDNDPKVLFPSLVDPAKQHYKAVLLGYLVMLVLTPGFPFAGHLYARRLGKLGILAVFLWLPYMVFLWSAEESEPSSLWWGLMTPMIVLMWALPLHAAMLMKADYDEQIGTAKEQLEHSA